jgi:hypothetical protein
MSKLDQSHEQSIVAIGASFQPDDRLFSRESKIAGKQNPTNPITASSSSLTPSTQILFALISLQSPNAWLRRVNRRRLVFWRPDQRLSRGRIPPGPMSENYKTENLQKIHQQKQWDPNVEPVQSVKPSHAIDIRSAFGLGDINPTVFLSPASWQTDLERWTDDDVSDGDRTAVRQRQVDRRTLHRATHRTGALGDRGASEQPMVFCGMGQEERGRVSCPSVH